MKHLASFCWLVLAPAAAQAAEGSEESAFWWKLFNFALLLGVLFAFARKPVLAALAERRGAIQKNLEASERLLADSQQKLAELGAKTARLDAEMNEIKAATRRSAEQQKAEILAEAAASAERMRQAASGVALRELRRAREDLRAETVALAVGLAEQLLERQVNDADHGRLVEEFIARVERGGAH